MKRSYERHAARRKTASELGTALAGAAALLVLGLTVGAPGNSMDPASHVDEGQSRAAEGKVRPSPHFGRDGGSVHRIETVPAVSGQARSALFTKDVAQPASRPDRVSALIQAHIATVNATLLAPEIAELCE